MLGKMLGSAWGMLLPVAVLPLFALGELSFTQWRLVMIVALLMTAGMLFHQRLRHFLLLPSFLALAEGLLAMTVNYQTM